jgi:hypothetical protein
MSLWPFRMLLLKYLNHRKLSKGHRQNSARHARSMTATQIGSEWEVVCIRFVFLVESKALSSDLLEIESDVGSYDAYLLP